ncbi:MAG TPA: hypothetical protein PKM04_04890 [Accumulibacter sp.]|nr:hypothetical protein [Accumulibacter sp.]
MSMRARQWRKLRRIFDPRDFRLANGCREFAQAPQAVVFTDFVRIYFSTRCRDPAGGGNYLSHVAFVDVAKHSFEILAVAGHTVIPLGRPGCFDEHGIFPLHVLRHGALLYGYVCGVNRRVSVPVDSAIGLAVSRDQGLTFQRVGRGPLLAASLHEPCLIADPCVRVVNDVFHMWYIFGAGWQRSGTSPTIDRIYKIGHAQSPDGVRWAKDDGRQIVSTRLGADECQAMPTVIELAGRHHMFFCYRACHDFRHNRARAYRLGHAHSDDLLSWTRDDDEMRLERSADGWDSEMLCYPNVFACDDAVYLLYNGNDFGRHGFGVAILD